MALRWLQLIQKELDFNRNKALWENKAISQAVYETAQSAYQIAEAVAFAANQHSHALDVVG